jgi:hypothetical protein
MRNGNTRWQSSGLPQEDGSFGLPVEHIWQ